MSKHLLNNQLMVKSAIKLKLVIVVMINLFCLLLLAQKPLEYQLDGNQRILVFNLEKEAISDQVKFFVGDKVKEGQSSIIGNYQYNEDTLVFKPHFPFSYGLKYATLINGEYSFTFEIPYPENIVAPALEAIYPSMDILPENQLKFYIQFDQPMSEGYAYKCVRLVSLKEGIIEEPFVQLQPELWDEERKRLTLWLDPGKIKRDLNPNLEKGTPLQKGQEYILLINGSWKSAYNLPLKANYHKSFQVGEADRIKPSLKNWNIRSPESAARSTLKIHFNEPLDRALLFNTIKVFNADNHEIEGQIVVLGQECQWEFTPNESWKVGAYRIRVDTSLEDLAGNNLNRLFDRDLTNALEVVEEKDFFWYNFIIE